MKFSIVLTKEDHVWGEGKEYREAFVRSMESYLDDILRVKGYLFVNKVFEYFNKKGKPPGQIEGWVYSKTKEFRFKNHYYKNDETLVIELPETYTILWSAFEEERK